MRPDVHVVDQDMRAEVQLRKDRYGQDLFAVMTRVLGCESDTARAAFVGVDARTISRARKKNIIGEEFMARAVAALRRHEKTLAKYGLRPTLDQLFIIVEVPVKADTAEAA